MEPVIMNHITFTFSRFWTNWEIWIIWFLLLSTYITNFLSTHIPSEGRTFVLMLLIKGLPLELELLYLMLIKITWELKNLPFSKILIGGSKLSPDDSTCFISPGLRTTGLEQPFQVLMLPFLPTSHERD